MPQERTSEGAGRHPRFTLHLDTLQQHGDEVERRPVYLVYLFEWQVFTSRWCSELTHVHKRALF